MLKHNVARLRDNVHQRRLDVAEAELRRFKEVGSQTIVEVSSGGLVPNYATAELARRPPHHHRRDRYYIGRRTARAGRQERRAGRGGDAARRPGGHPGTGVRAGVLGEIGTTEPLAPTERTVLEATGSRPRPARRSCSTRLGPPDLRADRAEPRHPGAGRRRPGPRHRQPLRRPPPPELRLVREAGGARLHLAFDTFGKQAYYETRKRQYPSDDQRIATIARLVGDGLAGSVTLAHDVCYKTDLTRWGGDGYGHVPRNIVPRLPGSVSEAAIQQMLVENPRRLLPLTR